MAELGHFALILGLFAAGYSVLIDLVGSWRKEAALITSGRNATIACWLCVTVATAALCVLLMQQDFTVKYVAEHTSRALPLVYKFSALWAGAAGSLLLWLWLQIGFATFVFRGTTGKERDFAAFARVAINIVSVFFLIILILDKSPFELSDTVPADGLGLNPLLQHPAMALHPPTLFIGYAGFIIPFAWAIAELKQKRDTRLHPLFVQGRNWALISWVFLTIGIVLGSWWAYEELGWGGYWAWDPVENSSLMPWLTATALLHCFRRYKPGTSTARWLTVLSLLTFSLCIFGTFLTRYGLVSSVHAFPEPGLGILFVVLLIVIWLVVALLAVMKMTQKAPAAPDAGPRGRRFISYNNWLMVLLTAVVFVGTMFPFFSDLFSGRKATWTPEFFTQVTAPLGLAFLLLIGICPELVRHGIRDNWRVVVGIIFALVGIVSWLITKNLAIPCFAFCIFATVNLVADFATGGTGAPRRGLRWYGARLTHIGVVLVFCGIAGSGAYDVEEQAALTAGQSMVAGRYTIRFDQLSEKQGPNFKAAVANVSVFRTADADRTDAVPLVQLTPAQAHYDSGKTTSEVDIKRSLARDLYVALTAVDWNSGLVNMRVLVKPLINWIWIGSTVSMVGASLVLFSFYRRRTSV